MNYAIYFGLSIFGGWLGYRLRFPMGAIIGAMIGVAIWKVLSSTSFQAPSFMTFLIQVCLGILIGLSFSSFDKQEFKSIVTGILIIGLGVLLMIYGTGWVIYYFTNTPLKVALISAAPGSIAEMATLANVLAIEPLIVVSLHLVRVVVIMLLLSFFVKLILNKKVQSKKKVEVKT